MALAAPARRAGRTVIIRLRWSRRVSSVFTRPYAGGLIKPSA